MSVPHALVLVLVPCQRQRGRRHRLQALLQLFNPIEHGRIRLVDLARPVLLQGVLGLRRLQAPQGRALLAREADIVRAIRADLAARPRLIAMIQQRVGFPRGPVQRFPGITRSRSACSYA